MDRARQIRIEADYVASLTTNGRYAHHKANLIQLVYNYTYLGEFDCACCALERLDRFIRTGVDCGQPEDCLRRKSDGSGWYTACSGRHCRRAG